MARHVSARDGRHSAHGDVGHSHRNVAAAARGAATAQTTSTSQAQPGTDSPKPTLRWSASASAAAGRALATAWSPPGNLDSGASIPLTRRRRSHSPFAAARFTSARRHPGQQQTDTPEPDGGEDDDDDGPPRSSRGGVPAQTERHGDEDRGLDHLHHEDGDDLGAQQRRPTQRSGAEALRDAVAALEPGGDAEVHERGAHHRQGQDARGQEGDGMGACRWAADAPRRRRREGSRGSRW